MTAAAHLKALVLVKALGLGMLGGAVLGALFGLLLILRPEDIRPSVAAACDKAVGALLAARDMVELERSKYLVKELDCSVRRRLRAEEALR